MDAELHMLSSTGDLSSAEQHAADNFAGLMGRAVNAQMHLQAAASAPECADRMGAPSKPECKPTPLASSSQARARLAVHNALSCLPFGRTVFQPSTQRVGFIALAPPAIMIPAPEDMAPAWQPWGRFGHFASHGDFMVVSATLRVCAHIYGITAPLMKYCQLAVASAPAMFFAVVFSAAPHVCVAVLHSCKV